MSKAGRVIDLSIVIPAYNEEHNIPATVAKVCGYLEGRLSYELIIVDDGSGDRTAAVLTSLEKDYPRLIPLGDGQNRGKGYAVSLGVEKARGRYLLYTDADLVYPIDGVGPFLDKLAGGFDLAIGSRVHPGSLYALHARHFPYIYQRHIVGRTYIAVVKRLLGLKVQDTQCGFKVLRGEVAKRIFSRVRLHNFAFDAEVLLIAQRLSYKTVEMPVYYLYLGEGSSVRMARDTMRMLLSLFQIRRNDRKGLYGQANETTAT